MNKNSPSIYDAPKDLNAAKQLESEINKPYLTAIDKGRLYCRLALFYLFDKSSKDKGKACHFFQKAMVHEDLLGTAYAFYYNLESKSITDNLTDFLKNHNLSIDKFQTLSKNNLYAKHLLGLIYENSLLSSETKKLNKPNKKEAIECFKPGLESLLLEEASKEHLNAIYEAILKDNASVKTLAFFKDLVNYIMEYYPDKMETNVFDMADNFNEILNNLSKASELKAPLKTIINTIKKLEHTPLTTENIEELYKKVKKLLIMILENDRSLTQQSSLESPLTTCRIWLKQSLESPNDQLTHLKSRLFFLSIFLPRIKVNLLSSPDKYDISLEAALKRTSHCKKYNPILKLANQIGALTWDYVCFGFVKSWNIDKYTDQSKKLEKIDKPGICDITRNTMDLSKQQYSGKTVSSYSIDFGNKGSKKEAIKKVIAILKKNKEQILNIHLRKEPHKRCNGHTLGVYMYDDEKVEFVDSNRGIFLFKNTKDFLKYLLADGAICFPKGEGKIILKNPYDFMFRKVQILLLSLAVILISFPIQHSITLIMDNASLNTIILWTIPTLILSLLLGGMIIQTLPKIRGCWQEYRRLKQQTNKKTLSLDISSSPQVINSDKNDKAENLITSPTGQPKDLEDADSSTIKPKSENRH